MDCTSPLWLMKCGQRELLYSKHRSCKGHLWLGNKTPRTRWYRVDLPVLLLASSVAWLWSGFLRAEWEGVCLCACERHYLSLSVWMPISWPCECDRCQVFLTCSVRAERNCCISPCVCVCKVCMRALTAGWFFKCLCLLPYVIVLNKHHLWKAHHVCFALGLCHGKAALVLPYVYVCWITCKVWKGRKPWHAASSERHDVLSVRRLCWVASWC